MPRYVLAYRPAGLPDAGEPHTFVSTPEGAQEALAAELLEHADHAATDAYEDGLRRAARRICGYHSAAFADGHSITVDGTTFSVTLHPDQSLEFEARERERETRAMRRRLR